MKACLTHSDRINRNELEHAEMFKQNLPLPIPIFIPILFVATYAASWILQSTWRIVADRSVRRIRYTSCRGATSNRRDIVNPQAIPSFYY